MPDIILISNSGLRIKSEVDYWPDPWDGKLPPVVMMKLETLQTTTYAFFNRTDKYAEGGFMVYTEVPRIEIKEYL